MAKAGADVAVDVAALLGAGRKDESGDFTNGAGLSAEQAEVVMGFVSAKRDSGAATVARLRELVGASVIGAEGVDELEQIADLLDRQGYGPDRIVLGVTDRAVDLIGEGIDCALRIGDLPDSTLIARPIALATMVTCASYPKPLSSSLKTQPPLASRIVI